MTVNIPLNGPSDQMTIGLLFTPAQWVDQVYAAHLAIYDDMLRCGKKSLVLRPKSYFEALSYGVGGGLIIATDQDNILRGFCALVAEDNIQQAMKNGSVSCPDVNLRIQNFCGHVPVGVIQSLTVLPNARGKGLSLDIIKAAHQVFDNSIRQPKKGCTAATISATIPKEGQLFAQVNITAECSWTKFMEAGFIMESTWLEQTKDGPKQKVLLRYASELERQMLDNAASFAFRKTGTDWDQPEQFHNRIVNRLQSGYRIMLLPGGTSPKTLHMAAVPA